MPSENVEIVQAIYDAWARGERPGPMELLDAQIEYVNPAGAIEPGTRRGLAAFAAAVEKTEEGWEVWQMEAERLHAAGDRVAAVVRYRARGRGSDVELEGRESALWTIRDRKVVRYEWFHDPDDAFVALGRTTDRAGTATARRMPGANVEFVEGLYAAAAAGTDKRTLLAALPEIIAQTCDPDVEWIEDPQRADGRIYRGHAGVRESWERWLEAFDEYSFEVEQIVGCGEDVFVVGREQVRGAASGAPMSSHTYAVLTVRDGKLLRYREFYDEHAARQAAGLRD